MTLNIAPAGEEWSVSPAQSLSDGEYAAHATQTNAAEETGQSASVTFTVNTRLPFGQQAKLTGIPAGSVALSADGATALVGGPSDNQGAGAAWVFTRSGTTWTQQGEKLTGVVEIGKGGFGTSVALSADGNTALVGGPSDNEGLGAAWVFTRSGSSWTQQGAELLGNSEIGAGRFGESVALAQDGATALIGGPSDNGNVGKAWVFTRSGTTWSKTGKRLKGGEEIGPARFGRSVALSGEGSTAIVGGPEDNWQGGHGCARPFTCAGGPSGAAWVLTRSSSTWSQQAKLAVAKTNQFGMYFGESVALSADGSTALVGAPLDRWPNCEPTGCGSGFVFVQSGSTWAQQGAPLQNTEAEEGDYFGLGVALSADGNTALIGGPSTGVGRVFLRSTASWAQEGFKLTCPEEGCGGVALSGDGQTAMIGTAVFARAQPTVLLVKPSGGRAAGGTTVTITGTNFFGVTAVKFGSVNATSFTVTSPTTLKAVSPAETAGTVDITVTTTKGTSAISSADHYKFSSPTITKLSPTSGSKAGGTTITVTGTGFAPGANGTTFKFGTTAATSVSCASMTTCTVVSPSHAVGTVDVRATVAGLKSPKVAADQFGYS